MAQLWLWWKRRKKDKSMTKQEIQEEEEQLSLERAFEQLDEMIGRLQDQETTLSDAVNTYRDGMELCRKCTEMIDLAQKQVLVLSGEEEGLEL